MGLSDYLEKLTGITRKKPKKKPIKKQVAHVSYAYNQFANNLQQQQHAWLQQQNTFNQYQMGQQALPQSFGGGLAQLGQPLGNGGQYIGNGGFGLTSSPYQSVMGTAMAYPMGGGQDLPEDKGKPDTHTDSVREVLTHILDDKLNSKT